MNIKLMIVGQYVKYIILVYVIKGVVYLRPELECISFMMWYIDASLYIYTCDLMVRY